MLIYMGKVCKCNHLFSIIHDYTLLHTSCVGGYQRYNTARCSIVWGCGFRHWGDYKTALLEYLHTAVQLTTYFRLHQENLRKKFIITLMFLNVRKTHTLKTKHMYVCMHVLPLLHSAIVILSNLVQMEVKLAAVRNGLLILTFCYCAVSAVSLIHYWKHVGKEMLA